MGSYMSLPYFRQTDMEAPSSSTVYESSASVTQKAQQWAAVDFPCHKRAVHSQSARTVELSGTDALVSLRLSAKELAKEKLWPQDLRKSQEDNFRTGTF